MSKEDKRDTSRKSTDIEVLEDLQLTAEQAEDTKAGTLEAARHEGAFMGNLFGATPVVK